LNAAVLLEINRVCNWQALGSNLSQETAHPDFKISIALVYLSNPIAEIMPRVDSAIKLKLNSVAFSPPLVGEVSANF
jgi:hypothetical protein